MLVPKAKLAAVALGTLLALTGATGHALQQAPTDPADAPPSPAPPARALSPREIIALKIAQKKEQITSKRNEIRFLRDEMESLSKDMKRYDEASDRSEAKIAAPPPESPAEKAPPALPVVEPPTAGASGARVPTTYLTVRETPTIVSVEDGHVATAFVFSDYVSTPGDDSKPAAPPDFKALKVGESDRRSVRLAAEGSPPIEVSWIEAGPFQALFMKGDRIERLAVYDGGEWFVQELAEPAQAVSPVINQTMASYAIGRRIYNYSHPAKRWEVLELPEGAEPNPMTGSAMILKHGDQYHRYDVETGRWSTLDVHLPPELNHQLEGLSVGGFH